MKRIFIIMWITLLLAMASFQATAQEKQVDEKKAAKLYQAAKVQLFQKNWQKALESFRILAEQYEGSRYSPEVFYWLGYSMNKYCEALEEMKTQLSYRRQAFDVLASMMEKYPDNRYVDDAKLLQLEIAQALAEEGLKTYQNFVDQRVAESEDVELKVAALSSLMRMDREKAYPILEEIVLEEKNAKLREQSLFILSQSRDPRFRPLLVKLALNDANVKIRERAIFWLGRSSGNGENLKILQMIYEKIVDRKLKEQLILAISRSKDPAALQELVRIARRDPDIKLREKALFWLGNLRSEKTVPILIEFFDSIDDSSLKESIVASLFRSKSDAAAEKLMKIVKDKNEAARVRSMAIFWLGQKRGPEVVDTLKNIYPEIVERQARDQIIRSLGRNRSEAAVDALIDLYRQEKDLKYKKSIISALGSTKNNKAMAFIQKILEDKDI